MKGVVCSMIWTENKSQLFVQLQKCQYINHSTFASSCSTNSAHGKCFTEHFLLVVW